MRFPDDWLSQTSGYAATALAVVAVVLTVVTIRNSRQDKRREAYFAVQQSLNSVEQHEGRALIYQALRQGHLPVDDDTYARINSSLDALNELGLLIYQGVVPRKWVLEAWHHALPALRPGYEAVVRLRMEQWDSAFEPFMSLGRLISDAERYRSSRGCCPRTRWLRLRTRRFRWHRLDPATLLRREEPKRVPFLPPAMMAPCPPSTSPPLTSP